MSVLSHVARTAASLAIALAAACGDEPSPPTAKTAPPPATSPSPPSPSSRAATPPGTPAPATHDQVRVVVSPETVNALWGPHEARRDAFRLVIFGTRAKPWDSPTYRVHLSLRSGSGSEVAVLDERFVGIFSVHPADAESFRTSMNASRVLIELARHPKWSKDAELWIRLEEVRLGSNERPRVARMREVNGTLEVD